MASNTADFPAQQLAAANLQSDRQTSRGLGAVELRLREAASKSVLKAFLHPACALQNTNHPADVHAACCVTTNVVAATQRHRTKKTTDLAARLQAPGRQQQHVYDDATYYTCATSCDLLATTTTTGAAAAAALCCCADGSITHTGAERAARLCNSLQRRAHEHGVWPGKVPP